MDYPKSVPSVGLVNGRFVDENPLAGTPGSLIPAVWGNSVTQEILGVISSAGMTPSEADSGQLIKALQTILGRSSPMRSVVTRLTASKALVADELGLVLIDASAGTSTVTLPAANAALGVRDVIVRRVDNSGNRLTVRASGSEKIRFHTHLAASGYPFLVLMGGGDWWHLRSDEAGGWWPVGRFDATALGRISFESTRQVIPGGYAVLNGNLLVRSDWPWLWDYVQSSGALVTEGSRGGNEGAWTSGDGATTFRLPDIRGEFLRVLDEARGVDVDRSAGSMQANALESHNHFLPTSSGSAVRPTPSIPDSIWDLAHDVNAAPVSGILGTTFPNPAYSSGTSVGSIGSFGTETRPRNIAYPARIKLI
ncbi:phage tail protein [Pseudomonas corrugata]|uniref:phage tail protein n=1 Tax=Pseudomonas corrugata TaxID=47879 RepID=UPI002233EC11|nr:phage tail protein [Pseudomonas corrugata]UZE07467.1 phage tail protein [Pseudomonas corrugata]